MDPRTVALAASLALAIALPSCRSEPPAGRALLIGIDGATLRIARPMLERGELPNLAAIAQAGVYGPLQSQFPLTSPRIWASIATGKLPDKHGIKGFAREGEGGERRLYQSVDRRVPALWSIASYAGFRVGVVNWWTTYPVEKVNGVIVSDHLLPQELAGRRGLGKVESEERGEIVYPPDWKARVDALLALDDPLTAIADPFADPSIYPDWILPERLSQRYRNDQSVTRIALAIDTEVRPELLMVFLPGIDRVSHRLWAGIEPESAYEVSFGLSDAQRLAMANGLHQYYRYTDALIGLLAARFGPDDLVFVVSDHGFEAGQKMMVLTGVHDGPKALHGVFFARGRDVAPPATPQRVVTVNDVAPTVLAWLGLPVGADMDGRPAPFLARPLEPAIASHDGTPIERLGEAPSGAEAEILEQLQALGYFEGERTGEGGTDTGGSPSQ